MADIQDPKSEVLKGEESLVLDHEYDGIKELDHPLPNWWLWIFYLTIAFSIPYAIYYMTGMGPTLSQELASDLEQIAKVQAAAPKPAEAGLEKLIAALKDPSQIESGKTAFIAKCAACHGDKGQGLIGPNLTDDYWLHGEGKAKDVIKVVSEGVLDKGMPAWGQVVSPDELVHLTAFIHSLRGTNPAGAKEAQGAMHAVTENE